MAKEAADMTKRKAKSKRKSMPVVVRDPLTKRVVKKPPKHATHFCFQNFMTGVRPEYAQYLAKVKRDAEQFQ